MATDTTNNIHMDIREGRIYIRIGNMEGTERGTEFVCLRSVFELGKKVVESCITNQNQPHKRGKWGKINKPGNNT